MLKGNCSKYKTMAVQSKREITNPTMSIQGSEIESTEMLNLLEVTIDGKLNFYHHINVCNKSKPKDWSPYETEKPDTNRSQAAAL